MKIDHPDTPFLFLDADDPCGEVAAIHPKYLSTHIPMAERTGAPLCGKQGAFGRPASPTRRWPTLGAAPSVLWRWSCLLVAVLWPNLGERRCLPHRCARYITVTLPLHCGVHHTGAPGPHQMQVKDLQDALGLVMTDEGGLASFTRPKWAHAEAFGAQRQVSG